MRPTIYLLDDEPEILTLLSDVAELSGLIPKSYTCGKDLLEEVKAFADNAILMLDLQMPQMDGIEVMRKLVQAQMSPRLILISGQDSGVLRSAKKLATAHGLEVITTLIKPLSIVNVIQVLKAQEFTQSSIKPSCTQMSVNDLTIERLRYASRPVPVEQINEMLQNLKREDINMLGYLRGNYSPPNHQYYRLKPSV